MKILFALDDFPPVTYTSASTLTYNFAKELLKRGHEVFVITSVQDKSKQGEEEYEGLKIFRIYSKYNIRWKAYLSICNPHIVFKFSRIIKRIQPDIVHFHHIHRYLSYCCLKIAKKHVRGVFLTVHDVMLVHYGKLMPKNGNIYYEISILDQIKEARKRYNPFRNIAVRHYLRYTDKIFTVSNSLKKVLEINGIKNIETIYNGINIDDWGRGTSREKIEEFKIKYNLKNKRTVLFGGRLSGAKGGDQILKAIALAKERLKNVVLIIAGEKNQYTEKAGKLIKELNIEENVIFTHRLDKEDLGAAYNASDLFVLPSLCFDSFPTMILEAMACRKPVIGTCFGGSNEIIIDNITGYLVNPNNVDLMSEKIIDLLKNPQKAKQFGEAGYNRAKEKFSFFDHSEEILKWYLKFASSD